MCSPHVRLAAMRLIVEAWDAMGMHDLAARMRERLSRESGEDGGAGSAPVPAPTGPISPVGSDQARKNLHEGDKIS